MARKAILIATAWITLLSVTSLRACDPRKRYWVDYMPYSAILNAQEANSDEYDGGWGIPQSSDLCNYDAECYPWRSGDGRFLLFASINFAGPPRPGHQSGPGGTENWDIYISEWDSVRHRWGEEKNMGPLINTGANERRPSCTWNCDTLYFNRWSEGDEDIYMSTFVNGNWTEPIALPAPVNTEKNDEHPAISADGKRLYFTSNRPEGCGGSDIWIARWDGSSWSSVINFGPPVNTFNEESRPFESYDGQRFYFTSHGGPPRAEGRYGAGDIYVCTKTDSGWGPVQVIAAPVNCDLEACSPYETPDGSELWIGSESWEGARGDEDIWVASRNALYPHRLVQGYGNWLKTGELKKAIYVYDLKEGAQGIIYAATACEDTTMKGKVFKTNDNGMTWTPCAELPGVMAVYTLIVRGDTIYAGTYPRGDVFKSTNRGNAWIPTADLPGAKAVRSLIRLKNGDIWAGTSPSDLLNRGRIFRSSDGGLSWAEVALLPHLNPCKFIYQSKSGAIFTGGWSHNTGVIIYRTTNYGITWDTTTVISDREVDWGADHLFETHDGTIYVTGRTPSHGVGKGGGYVCKSTDHGTTWTECSKILRGDGVHSDRVYTLIEDRTGTLYAGIQPAPDSVVFASADGGQSWYSTGGLDGAFECLTLLYASDGSIYAGTTPYGDVFRYLPITKVDENTSTLANDFQLSQNYPNPFNSETTIRFHLLKESLVKITVYDMLGQKVKTIADDYFVAGWHIVVFDGMDRHRRAVATGVYFYRLVTDGFECVKKCICLK
ncbi:PD40 domain-containing protein [candidate division KSB1 bacterium]|nr:PD40 domain-containing protein [candidate division KSB1 bacterium]